MYRATDFDVSSQKDFCCQIEGTKLMTCLFTSLCLSLATARDNDSVLSSCLRRDTGGGVWGFTLCECTFVMALHKGPHILSNKTMDNERTLYWGVWTCTIRILGQRQRDAVEAETLFFVWIFLELHKGWSQVYVPRTHQGWWHSETCRFRHRQI